MNSSRNNESLRDEQRSNGAGSADETLRLIAGLPAPEGLVDRMKAGLRATPQTGRVLSWRVPHRSGGGWMQSSVVRGAAAAAIVCVVAGGGWRIYSHVQSAPSAKVIVMPPRVGPAAGGFSPAGAKRVPETLDGPVLKHPVQEGFDQKDVGPVPAASASKATPGGLPARKKKAASRAGAPLQ